MGTTTSAIAVFLVIGTWTASARADGTAKVRCEASYEAAQRMKRDEQLSAAKAQLAICTQTCPGPLAADCNRWLAEIEQLVPTVRVAVKASNGWPLDDVRVTMDGKELTLPSDGRALAVEPGSHIFHFERAGFAPAEVRVDIHAGDRNHAVDGVLAPAAAQADGTPKAKPQARSPIASYVLGGIGVAALLGAGALSLKGHLDRNELRSSCYPYCSEDDVAPIRTMWTASGVLAGASVAALVAAVLLWPRSNGAATLRQSRRDLAFSW